MKYIIVALLLTVSAFSKDVITYTHFINALIQVESDGRNNAVGDNGKAVGPLQIHPVMVKDVNRIIQLNIRQGHFTYKDIKPFTLEDRTNRKRAQHMASIYFMHYCTKHLDPYNWEALARAWNGGPSWHKNKKATDHYWSKVKKELDAYRRIITDIRSQPVEGSSAEEIQGAITE